MYPFSFKEFLDYKKELNSIHIFKNELKTDIENLFDEYLEYGGLPSHISGYQG